jgi:hypothetical protein|uniref:Uncharacterized protein n=1 Tax=Eutreptiella gymnastica TaxID=73025 RepID=A0A7S4CCU3_9EUGL
MLLSSQTGRKPAAAPMQLQINAIFKRCEINLSIRTEMPSLLPPNYDAYESKCHANCQNQTYVFHATISIRIGGCEICRERHFYLYFEISSFAVLHNSHSYRAYTLLTYTKLFGPEANTPTSLALVVGGHELQAW